MSASNGLHLTLVFDRQTGRKEFDRAIAAVRAQLKDLLRDYPGNDFKVKTGRGGRRKRQARRIR